MTRVLFNILSVQDGHLYMTFRSFVSQSGYGSIVSRSFAVLALGSVMLGTVAAAPSWAKDPFGRDKPIGDATEKVFRAIFDEGNYKKAEGLLPAAEQADPDEPLLYALKASLLFAQSSKEYDTSKGDTAGFATAAIKTQETAKKLMEKDKPRGELYVAVGNFLESAHIIATNGIVQGTPGALGKLTKAFQALGEAEKLAPNDPEFNLVKGSMDLMLAINVNLPLSDSGAALARIEGIQQPKYVADRILAWGFRDMKQQDKALAAVDRAISGSPSENPELYYLKGQILVQQNKKAESVQWFQKALAKKDYLTPSLIGQFCYDLRGADPSVAAKTPGCPAN